jgi:hypothetical protein
MMGILPPHQRPPINRPNTATMDFTDEPVMDMVSDKPAEAGSDFLRRAIIIGVLGWIVIIAVIVALITIF